MTLSEKNVRRYTTCIDPGTTIDTLPLTVWLASVVSRLGEVAFLVDSLHDMQRNGGNSLADITRKKELLRGKIARLYLTLDLMMRGAGGDLLKEAAKAYKADSKALGYDEPKPPTSDTPQHNAPLGHNNGAEGTAK